MRLSKSQSTVLIILSVIIAALLCVAFVIPRQDSDVPPQDGTGGNTVVDAPARHDKFRAATAGRVDAISRETRLMGSGDETVLSVYNTDDGLYIFGNATVGDYDFDGYGGFLCVVDGDGKITDYKYFSGRMTAVSIIPSGFAVATVSEAGTSRERNALYSVTNGEVVERAEVSRTVLDILVVDETRIAVITKVGANCISLTEYIVSGGSWSRDRSTDVSSAFGLEYLDCCIVGDKYVTIARATSLPRYDAIMFFSFAAGGDPAVYTYGGSDDNMLQPYAVMPYRGGYAVLAKRSGAATVIGIDYSFKSYKRDFLGFSADGASLVCDGKNYYACFITSSGAVTYALDDELKTGDKLTAFDGMTLEKAVGNPATFFAKTDSALTVSDVTGTKKTTLEISGAKIHSCFFDPDGTKTVVLSATGGGALSAPTGGRDVYVVKMK